ncbi:hypothetical protein N7466_001109 [Penicillium verhagenii]|uniref:uncharacterized protein n=1 Tax=Penicillium verhagenii TaxID=1562060 RepID=UPI002545B2EC|nr:uncharacterized protein N7466_001109 [Penicillium verhagenii]KAJ5948094.1 hypothetical protein N7466_001109 [Penicillium verhagenii]
MCSVYIFLYDCGCSVQEGGVVACAKKGTPSCHGVKEHFRKRQGYNCPKHGGNDLTARVSNLEDHVDEFQDEHSHV